jgi:hypothetical protein
VAQFHTRSAPRVRLLGLNSPSMAGTEHGYEAAAGPDLRV